MQMFEKGYHNFRISNDTFNPFHRRIIQKTKLFFVSKKFYNFYKNANQ